MSAKIEKRTFDTDVSLGPLSFRAKMPVGSEVLGGKLTVSTRGSSIDLDVLVPSSAGDVVVTLAAVTCGYALPGASYGLVGRLTVERYGDHEDETAYLFHMED